MISARSCRRFRSSGVAMRPRLSLHFGAHCESSVVAGSQRNESFYFASHSVGGFGLATSGAASFLPRILLQSAHDELARRERSKLRPSIPETYRNAVLAARTEVGEGRCVVLLAQLHSDTITVLNFGDCGIVVLRPTSVLPEFHGGQTEMAMRTVFRSSSTEDHLMFDADNSNSDRFDLTMLKLRRGDFIVAGGAVLFDSVTDDEIASLILQHHQEGAVGRATQEHSKLQYLASDLTSRAVQNLHAMSGHGVLSDVTTIIAKVADWSPSVIGGLLQNMDA